MLLRLVRLALFPSVASTTFCLGFRDPSACSGETARTNSILLSARPSSPTARTAGSGRRCTTCPVGQVNGILAKLSADLDGRRVRGIPPLCPRLSAGPSPAALGPVRHRVPKDAAPHGRVLAPQRPARVRDPVPGADLAHPWREFGVAVAGQVGEDVVLDLVAQVAGEHVEEEPPSMFAEPWIWRRYHWPRVSPSSCSSSYKKVWTSPGKWPQKITVCAQMLRSPFAVTLPTRQGSAEGPASRGRGRSPWPPGARLCGPGRPGR